MPKSPGGFLAFILCVLLAPAAFAQNAQITGIVRDWSGEVVITENPVS